MSTAKAAIDAAVAGIGVTRMLSCQVADAARAGKLAVPRAIPKRGGRKVAVSPDGSLLPGVPRQETTNADPTLLRAPARAFRWKKLPDDGIYASVSNIARAEKLDRT